MFTSPVKSTWPLLLKLYKSSIVMTPVQVTTSGHLEVRSNFITNRLWEVIRNVFYPSCSTTSGPSYIFRKKRFNRRFVVFKIPYDKNPFFPPPIKFNLYNLCISSYWKKLGHWEDSKTVRLLEKFKGTPLLPLFLVE